MRLKVCERSKQHLRHNVAHVMSLSDRSSKPCPRQSQRCLPVPGFIAEGSHNIATMSLMGSWEIKGWTYCVQRCQGASVRAAFRALICRVLLPKLRSKQPGSLNKINTRGSGSEGCCSCHFATKHG